MRGSDNDNRTSTRDLPRSTRVHLAEEEVDENGERPEAMATDLEQAMDANSRLLKDLVDELQHHDVALKRISARLTLLEGVALGVSQPQPLKLLVLADKMLLL